MNTAFNISHFHNNEVYFVVGGDGFAKNLNLFLNNFTTITANELDSFRFHLQFLKNREYIFLTGNYLHFDIQQFCQIHNYEINKVLALDTTEYTSSLFLHQSTTSIHY